MSTPGSLPAPRIPFTLFECPSRLPQGAAGVEASAPSTTRQKFAPTLDRLQRDGRSVVFLLIWRWKE
jgi:hypothetical protein